LYEEEFDIDPSNRDEEIVKTYKVDYTLRQYTSAHKYAIQGELERTDGSPRHSPQYNAMEDINSEIRIVTGAAANRATLGILCSPNVVDTSNPIDAAIIAKAKDNKTPLGNYIKAYNDLVVTCRDGKATSVRKSSVSKLAANDFQWVVGKLKALSASQPNQTKLSCPQSIQQIDVSRGKLVKTTVCTDRRRKCVDQ
jgi:hypothetical protein